MKVCSKSFLFLPRKPVLDKKMPIYKFLFDVKIYGRLNSVNKEIKTDKGCDCLNIRMPQFAENSWIGSCPARER